VKEIKGPTGARRPPIQAVIPRIAARRYWFCVDWLQFFDHDLLYGPLLL